MNKIFQKSEGGQAAVLLVLVMVVLLGFAALAVDGGAVYADRRFTQSGADASSMGGGAAAAQAMDTNGVTESNWTARLPNCTTEAEVTAAKNTAVSQAAANDFTISQDRVKVGCGIETITAPKVGGGSFILYTSHYMDITTTLTSTTQTSFAHFVFKGIMQNTTTAVTRVRPLSPAVYGFAIVALNDDGCSGNSNGNQMHGLGGSGDLTVTGGGIFSNGCMDVDGNVNVAVNNGSVAYFYTGNHSTLGHIAINNSTYGNPTTPTQLTDVADNRIPQAAYDIPLPDCNAAGAHNNVDQAYLTAHQPLSGLYCIDGGLNINNAHESLVGTNVTLFFRGGGVTINGGTVNLTAPPSHGYSGAAIPGTLIYMPRQYYDCSRPSHPSNTLTINGNAGNTFTGVLLAPCSSITLSGSSNNFAFNSQVIGYNVDIGGSSGTQVIYDADKQWQRPAYLDLYR